jgi:phage-related protein
MKLPENVKPYPRLFKIFRIFSPKGFNIGTTIYLNKNIYLDLQKDNPKLENIAVLKHEEVHVKRVKEVGTLKFGYKYTFSPKFRLDEELIAYKVMFSFLKEHNASYDLDRVARALSGPRYLWVKPYKEAIKIIEKTWEEA